VSGRALRECNERPVSTVRRNHKDIRNDNLCAVPHLACPGNVKVNNGYPLRTYSPAAGRPRPVRSKEFIDEYTEETRHPVDPVGNAVVRGGGHRSCATAPRPAIPGRSAGSATAPSSRSAARGAGGLQEREQRSAMQLHLTARRSGERNMPRSRRGQAACVQAEPSAGGGAIGPASARPLAAYLPSRRRGRGRDRRSRAIAACRD
jgi:hypothetical protein